VLFGDAERRDLMASELGTGLGVALAEPELDRRRRGVQRLEERVRWIEASLRHDLVAELGAEEFALYEAEVPMLVDAVPGAFDPELDLERVLADARAETSPGLFGGRRPDRRVVDHLRSLLRAGPHVDLVTIVRALSVARARRSAVALANVGGTTIDTRWDELARADAELALGVGSLVADRTHAERAVTPQSRAAVAALATTLRADRAWRRLHLASLDGSSLLQALPLWIGTLRDIDDLLPPTPGLFDLVILDEAAQIDQPTASLALLRADRAVVVGDPHQLRHEHRLDPLEVATAIDVRSLTSLAARLAPGNSAFDVAAGAAPVTWLDEHFRSAPHLIEFSAEHFYPHPFHLMTRHPRNESLDVIDRVRVDGARDEHGVNRVEVDAVRVIVEDAIGAGWTNIGVLAPLPEQAEALEAMLVGDLGDQVAAVDLVVGDVDDFQGSERDLVVLSLGVDAASVRANGWRARLEDPNRFNVLVTRARERLVLVTSVGAEVGGLLGAFLAYADRAPRPGPPGPPRHRWIAAVADELARLGVTVRPEYAVGQWRVDLCIGDGERAMAVECTVHPAGAAVHIERHRALRRAGWRIIDCFASRWEGDAVSAAVALATELRRDPRR
jgi:hypothetical protein